MDTQALPSLAMVVVVSLLRTKTSYRRLHVTYFIVLTFLGALSLWLAPKPHGSPRMPFIDALYNSVSALSVTGLASVEMHRLATSDFVTLILLMILGSQIFTSAIPLFIRSFVNNPAGEALANAVKRANSVGELQFAAALSEYHNLSTAGSGVVKLDDDAADVDLCPANGEFLNRAISDGFIRRRVLDRSGSDRLSWLPVFNSRGNESAVTVKRGVSMPVLPTIKSAAAAAAAAAETTTTTVEPVPEAESIFRWSPPARQRAPFLDRVLRATKSIPLPGQRSGAAARTQSQMSVLMNVKEEQERLRKEAGALKALCWLVVGYWITMQAVGFLVTELCVVTSRRATGLLEERNVKRSFFSFFTTVSSFANAGFVPLDDNLVGLNKNEPLLLWIMVLILVGNTAYAPMLRLGVWVVWKLAPKSRLHLRESLRYLLDRPRSCYTHLFPRAETLWLLLTVAVFNGVQIAVISGLDWGSGSVFGGLTYGQKIVDVIFSSVTTRNAGLNVVNTAAFSAPTLLLAAGMMYVAVYPVYLSRQHSQEPTIQNDGSITNPQGEIYMQCRKLFARDSVYLFIAIFLVCVTERHAIRDDPLNFSVFNVIFEVISGYGNVGLSLGYSCSLKLSGASTCTDVPYSFSGKWTTLGKLIIVIVMLLGRHRGLPEDVDWAIAPPQYK